MSTLNITMFTQITDMFLRQHWRGWPTFFLNISTTILLYYIFLIEQYNRTAGTGFLQVDS